MADRTVTVGPGKIYASLAAALAGEDGYDCSAATGNSGMLYIDCYAFEDTAAIAGGTLATGITTDSNYYVKVRAIDKHDGTYDTSAYRRKVTGTYDITIDADKVAHIEFDGIAMDMSSMSATATGLNTNYASTAHADAFIRYIDCIVAGPGSGIAAFGIANSDTPTDIGDGVYAINCIIYGFTNASSVGLRQNSGAAIYAYNCTIDDCTLGIDVGAGGTIRLKNSRVTACTTVADGALHADSDYNLTDGTAPTNWGTNSLDSTDTPTIDYVDDSNATLTSRDYHLASASDSGVGAGQDLSSDSDYSFSTDIDGDTRG